MTSPLLMGLDIGGSGGRCVVANPETGAIVSAFRAWSHPTVSGTGGLGFDLAVDDVLRALAEVSREALARSGGSPEQVVAISTSAQRHGAALLDRDGEVVIATPTHDARPVAQGLIMGAQRGEEIHRKTGIWPSPVCAAPLMQMLAAEDAERFARVETLLGLSEWLAYRLCGERVAEPTTACGTLLFELEQRAWSDSLIEALALPRSLFPAVVDAGTRLGALSKDAAAWLGLSPGIHVSVGGGDTQCGLLGAAVVEPGEVGAVIGTTAPIQLVVDRPVVDAQARTWSGHHLVPGRWVVESNAGSMGDALQWVGEALYPDLDHPLIHLSAEAGRSPVGAMGALSTVGADIMNARSMQFPLSSLTWNPSALSKSEERRAHLARATLEGMAYAVRANLEQIAEVAGCDAAVLRAAGGMTRSPVFLQILSDVIRKPVRVAATTHASALGAAICAGVGAGLFDDMAAGSRAFASDLEEFQPDRERADAYDACFGDWRRVLAARSEADAIAREVSLKVALAEAGPSSLASAQVRPRILVTADLDEAALEALEALGDVEYASFRNVMRLLTGPGLVEALEGYQVFITEVDVVDAKSLRELPELRVVASCRGDAVNVDIPACTELGIPVLNAPGRNADAVADIALAFMLSLARKLPEAGRFLLEPGGEAGDMGRMGRAFQKLRGRELWQKTVGMIGLGAVGRKVVARVKPFGTRVVVYDPFLSDDAVRLAGAEPAPLESLLAQSDFVSLHAAVTDESRGLLGEGEFAQMKAGAFVINTARAALIDEAALRAALESGHLGGAALDVFEVEPPASDDPLIQLPNVIATPHVGGNTHEVSAHQGQIIAEDLGLLLRGGRPLRARNPEVLSEFSWTGPRRVPDPARWQEILSGPGASVTDLQKNEKPKKKNPDTAAKAVDATPGQPAEEPSVSAVDLEPIQNKMREILTNFLERVVADPGMQRFSDDKDVTLHFTLNDLGLEFYLRLRGETTAAVSAPDVDAEVELKMKADVLDGMFTGRVNAMNAAMEGDLAFSGDTAKAMTLQEINADLSRLYREAREEVGDPGDLSNLGGTADSKAAAATKAVKPGDVREELVQIVNELFAQQLITATGGNVSVRDPDARDEVWITPSQLFKGDLAPEILVRMNMAGKALDEGARSPSSERLMHTAVLAAKSEANAVIHAHAPHATILANSELPFLPISTEAAFFSDIPRVPFIMPGTQELADALAEAIGDGWAVLMQNHGLLVAGRSLRRAADMVEIIERTCEVILGCYAVGKEPPVLPPDTVKTLRKMGDLVA